MALHQASRPADVAAGETYICGHVVREGDNRLGPNLYKVVGRKAGSLPDYAFSSAMKEPGFVWDEEKLDRFIANPDQVVPGNSMKPYGGLSSSDDRKKSSPSLLRSTNATYGSGHPDWAAPLLRPD
jgi:cytochrome c